MVKIQFSGFLPLKIILITSFIILMQSGFLYRGYCVGIGTGDFYSYNEIILKGNILMESVDCNSVIKRDTPLRLTPTEAPQILKLVDVLASFGSSTSVIMKL